MDVYPYKISKTSKQDDGKDEVGKVNAGYLQGKEVYERLECLPENRRN